MSLLPNLGLTQITHARRPLSSRSLEDLDAVLVLVPASSAAKALAKLPEAQSWQKLNARTKARAGTARSTTLANRRGTLAVLGYVRESAPPFEVLTLAGSMLREIAGRGAKTVGLATTGDDSAGLEALLAATLAHAFALPVFRSSAPAEDPRPTRVVLFGGAGLDVAQAAATARGNNLARWLTALPPNKLDAPTYRKLIAQLARSHGLTMRWLDERALRELGANAFLAVSSGNAERTAGIAHLQYRPRKGAGRAPDVSLVGKGIIFDTGGTNLKTHRHMLDMHTDMAGSAVALASILALAELKSPIAADAWLAITENRTGPTAYKPQDVVQAANGVTIQVIHTDAEGRMALADTLALAARTKPRLILDYATLTGACVYSLTERMSGVFTNTEGLTAKLLAAGRASGERVWNFPFDDDFDRELESKVADVIQCTVDGKGDHILAARFLSRFVPPDTPWAHFDLSAATRTGGLAHVPTEVTGFGVRYTLELLLNQRVLADLGRGA
jgi:leucyl aminopeptidase